MNVPVPAVWSSLIAQFTKARAHLAIHKQDRWSTEVMANQIYLIHAQETHITKGWSEGAGGCHSQGVLPGGVQAGQSSFHRFTCMLHPFRITRICVFRTQPLKLLAQEGLFNNYSAVRITVSSKPAPGKFSWRKLLWSESRVRRALKKRIP